MHFHLQNQSFATLCNLLKDIDASGLSTWCHSEWRDPDSQLTAYDGKQHSKWKEEEHYKNIIKIADIV